MSKGGDSGRGVDSTRGIHALRQNKRVELPHAQNDRQLKSAQEYKFLRDAKIKKYTGDLEFHGFKNTWQTQLVLALILMNSAVGVADFAKHLSDNAGSDLQEKDKGLRDGQKPKADKKFLQTIEVSISKDIGPRERAEIMARAAEIPKADEPLIRKAQNFVEQAMSKGGDKKKVVEKKAVVESRATASKVVGARSDFEDDFEDDLVQPAAAPEKSFDQIFDEAKERIEVVYSDSYKGRRNQDAVKENFRKSLRAFVEEGNEKRVGFLLKTINAIKLYDYNKMSSQEIAEANLSYTVGAYNYRNDEMVFGCNFDAPYQDIGIIDHELTHREQLVGRSYPSKQYLDRCVKSIEEMKEEAYRCIFSSLPKKDCLKMLKMAANYDKRPLITSGATDDIIEEFISMKHGFKTKVIKEVGGCKIHELVSYFKDGEEIEATKEQKKVHAMLHTVILNMYMYEVTYNNHEMPTDKDAKYDRSLFNLFSGVTFEQKFGRFFVGLVELEAHINSALPLNAREEICGAREEDNNPLLLTSAEEQLDGPKKVTKAAKDKIKSVVGVDVKSIVIDDSEEVGGVVKDGVGTSPSKREAQQLKGGREDRHEL